MHMNNSKSGVGKVIKKKSTPDFLPIILYLSTAVTQRVVHE